MNNAIQDVRKTKAVRENDIVTITTPYSAVTIKYDTTAKMLDQLRRKYRMAVRRGQSEHYLLTLKAAGEHVKSHIESADKPQPKPLKLNAYKAMSKAELTDLLRDYECDIGYSTATKATLITILLAFDKMAS